VTRTLAPRRMAAAALVLSLLAPAAARAQDPAQSAIDAQAQYDLAMATMQQGRYDAACRMLEQVASRMRDSIAARIALAECYIRSDRLATALERYATIETDAALALQRTRAAQVRARIETLRARVPHLVVKVPKEVRALAGLEIRCRGARIDPSQFGVPMPMDGGLHTLEVTATGKEPLVRTVAIDQDGVTYSITVAKPNPLPGKPFAPLSAAVPVTTETTEPSARKGSVIPGVVVSSAGATALGIGALTGGITLDTASALKGRCRDNLCPLSQKDRAQRAEVLATVATAELVAGALVAAVGTALLVTRPFGRKDAAAAVMVGPGSLWLVGRF
jgi:hypothetical protein